MSPLRSAAPSTSTKKIAPAIKAVLYPRVSSEKQVREGNGLQTQEHRCRAYAESKGYVVAAVFAEESLSGAVLHRPAMQRLLAYLDEHPGQETVIVIDDLKRLARDVGLYFTLKTAIQSRGGRLESPLFRFEDTPEGKFIETIVAAQAELERNQNKRQVVNRMKARLEMGFWPFVAPPGYRWNKDATRNKVLERDEPRAALIAEALEGFAAGRFASPVEVQRFLTHAGYFGVVSNPYNAKYLGQVFRLLRQELYTGHIVYRPWDVALRPGHHPALISLATFHEIQDRLNGKQDRNPVRADTTEEFALRGFVACASCGRLLTASWTRGRHKRYAYYHCQERACKEYGKSIARDRLHADFERLLGGVGASPDVLDFVRQVTLEVWERKTRDLAQETTSKARRVREIEADLRALADKLGRTSSDTAARVLETRIEEREAERLALWQEPVKSATPRADYGTAFDAVRSLIENPLLLWQTGSRETKRLVPRLVFTSLLPYDRKSGFGTADLALPYLVLGRIAGDKSYLVDSACETWNHLIKVVIHWSEAIKGYDCPGFP